MSSKAALVIGVDGGATAVRAWAVDRPLDLSEEGGFAVRDQPVSRVYERAPDFVPLPLADQRAGTAPPHAEGVQAELCLDAAASCIEAVAQRDAASHVRVAVCLPGLKSTDGRGVAAALHLPRIPAYLDRLFERLGTAGLSTAGSLGRLPGDGEACGLGEEHGVGGGFRGTSDALYVGGGTGLAEAFKLAGRLVPPGQGLPRAWELDRSSGTSFEGALSAAGINRRWARRAGVPLPREKGDYPEDHAAAGVAEAIALLDEVADDLAQLVALRAAAWPEVAGGARLARVVLGQRLGAIAERAGARFGSRAATELARRAGSGHHAPEITASRLREAAALGAVAALELRTTP